VSSGLLRSVAEKYRLKLRADECGDPIIRGSRGNLYEDGDRLCLIGLDSRISLTMARRLGGDVWVGTTWYDDRRRGHRDVTVKGIPPKNWLAAIRLAGCRQKRELSEEKIAELRNRLQRARPLRRTAPCDAGSTIGGAA